ncbi:MAG: FAD-binding protein [Bacillota bacterium]
MSNIVTQIETDVLVVGSEGTGARAAIEADNYGARTILASKGIFGGSGVTLMAPYSCCVAFGHEDPRDNPREHEKDTIMGGQFLGNQRLIRVYTENAPQRMLDLESYGARFNKKEDGKFEQVLMPGHRFPRAIHYKFATGKQFRKGLMNEVGRRPNIKVYEDFFVLDLLVESGKISGALALDLRTGELVLVKTGAVILATGGAMEMFYPRSDASCDLTGDSHAMALRAGAQLRDLEFMQFFPTGMVHPPALNGVIWIGQLRYKCGGLLYNRYGERFMKKYDPVNMELSTRDLVSRAMATEIIEGRGTPHGGVWLDVSYLGDNIVEAYAAEVFPNFSFRGYNLLEAGVDIRKDAIEVAPMAHFYMGGITINEFCETGIEGLYAAGEVTAGINGANRIEGNALSEIQVFGAIAGQVAAQYAGQQAKSEPNREQVEEKCAALLAPLERNEGVSYFGLRRQAQEIMWTQVGLVRDGEKLEKAAAALTSLREQSSRICVRNKTRECNREWMEALETQNMLLLAEAMARSALYRKETRGAHYRRDYPEKNNDQWLVNVVATLEGEKLNINQAPVEFTYLKPEEV